MKNFKIYLIILGLLQIPTVHCQDSKSSIAHETAIFAGGCFWCMQPPYDLLKSEGVVEVVAGYTGGHIKNPTYKQVSEGNSGHREVVKVLFDPKKITYEKLLEVFWKNIDPFDEKGQFCDKGFQYSSAIYFSNEAQRISAEQSKAKTNELFAKQKIITSIEKAAEFYAAEDYHQSYYLKNPVRYKYYRYSCGRDKRLNELYGKSVK